MLNVNIINDILYEKDNYNRNIKKINQQVAILRKKEEKQ